MCNLQNIISVAFLLYFNVDITTSSIQPEQIHLAYGEQSNDIVITWSTLNETTSSIVQYGLTDLKDQTKGSSKIFIDDGELKRSQYIHTATLKNLAYNSTYLYRCGSDGTSNSNLSWSEIFSFKTPPQEHLWWPTFAVLGDMGSENDQIMPRLQDEVLNRSLYDAVMHNGDFAYNLDSNDGLVGDEFMKQIEPIAARLPYLTSPGNHEKKNNFSHYVNRFNMPGLPDYKFYSMNLGPIHFISLSTEDYHYPEYVSPLLQYNWLKNDLIIANQPENRSKQPWIITMAHRPMYCTSKGKHCKKKETSKVRTGTGGVQGLEDLFYIYGVDLGIWAHQHAYERLWPVYNYTVLNGSLEYPYRNPRGPVYITTGSAGSKENLTTFGHMKEWSAFRNLEYGYSRLRVYNNSHLYMEQVSVNGDTVDSFWLVKDNHGPY